MIGLSFQIFSCDSSSIRDNVRPSVCRSVGLSVCLSPTSFKVCIRIPNYMHTYYYALNIMSRHLAQRVASILTMDMILKQKQESTLCLYSETMNARSCSLDTSGCMQRKEAWGQEYLIPGQESEISGILGPVAVCQVMKILGQWLYASL